MDNTNTLILDSLSEIKSSISDLKTKVSELDSKVSQLDTKVSQLDTKVSQLDTKVSQLDTKVTRLDADNKEEHAKIFDAINSLNRSFLKSEVETSDKIRILFDADVDRKDHQTIYNQQISNLNNLVSNNVYRISNLEKYNKH